MCAVRPNGFLSSKVFTLCRSEDRIQSFSTKNGLVLVAVEVLATHNTDLVTQSQVLELEGGTRSEDRKQICEECREGNEHQREL